MWILLKLCGFSLTLSWQIEYKKYMFTVLAFVSVFSLRIKILHSHIFSHSFLCKISRYTISCCCFWGEACEVCLLPFPVRFRAVKMSFSKTESLCFVGNFHGESIILSLLVLKKLKLHALISCSCLRWLGWTVTWSTRGALSSRG